MSIEPRIWLSRSRLIGLLVIVVAAFVIGLLLSLPATADLAGQESPRGQGTGSLRLLSPSEYLLDSQPVRVLLSPDQWTTILSENFEGTWPTGNWGTFDNDGATNGEYFWANRCAGRNSTLSAWAIGGGANGNGLVCGAAYPNQLDSWVFYGPVDLGQATDAELTFYFWLNSECQGAQCATKSDRLWAAVSTDGQNFAGAWWAGDWFQDASADPNGWVAGTLDMSSFVGQSQVWIAFIFQSDSTTTFPGGAYVDDVVLRAITTCPVTANVTLGTDTTCYRPGTQIGALVTVGTSLSSQLVRAEVTLWSGDVIWASAEDTFTAPGQRVIPLQIPADLFPGDYIVMVRVFDANSNCFQASAQRTILVDPTCGTPVITHTPTATPTPTQTRTPTATSTRPPTVTPTIVATLCPGESIHETKNIFIPPAPGRADVLFAFDTTSSMGNVLSSAKSNAVTIMNNLAGLIPDIQFGVVDLRDYPIPPYGDPGDWPYLLRQAITGNRTAVEAAINATSPNGGSDYPEAYTRALYESYSDSAIGWRTDARRFVVMFGDDVPHDNNLNERVTNPPVNPGGTWCGDTSAGCVRDPGRDGQPGTADDLDFQTVLDALKANRITLLYVVSGGGSTSQSNLVTYWKQWTGWTSTGGDAVPLADAANLPTVIQNLITSASRRISRLELLADPPSYQSWLTVNPPAYTDLDIPPGGRTVSFEVDIRVPLGTPIGTVHTFAIKAIGDGANYGGQGVRINVPATCATATPTPTATQTPTRTPTRTATPTATVCPPTRPEVNPTCPEPNYVRNPYFEKFNRSWGEYATTGRELVSSTAAAEGFYSARFEGPLGQTSDEILYQYLNIPPDATAASFWVEFKEPSAPAVGYPPISGRDFFRASIYDLTMTTELVRLWQFDPLSQCPIDPSSYNLTEAQLNLLRGRTVALVFELRKYTTGWYSSVILDGIHFTVCSPSPPCRVERDKTASPSVVLPGGEVTVMLSLTGLDGACLPHRKPADVMLVFDRSGSMADDTQPGGPPQPLTDAKNAAKGFVDRMDLSTDQVGLVSFASSATLDQTLTQAAGPVRTAIDGMSASGGTNIADALSTAQAELTSGRHRAGNQPVLILLSDGQPTAGGDPRAPAAAAKAAGTRIFTIGLGAGVDPNLMRELASSAADYFFAPDSSQLDAIYQQIAGAISGSPATNITIVDRLSQYVTLVPNSFTGSPVPTVSADERTLTWKIPRLGLETRVWSYRVKMTQTPGTWPTNDYATATYTNSQGQPASLTFPIPQVTVLPPAERHPQIMCRDHSTDNGSVPSNPNGESWWQSPDIWVRNRQDGVPAHQNPIAGQTNYVYVRVQNIGDTTVSDIKVHVYDAVGAANLRWPDDWAPEIGVATIASLPAGQTAVVAVPWTPVLSGHYCFLTRIEAPDDPITFDGWVPFDNNICQRNVQIIESGTSSTGVNVGNRERGSGYGSVSINSSNFPNRGGGTVTFTNPALFQRWQQAGGTVSGGEVVTSTNSIRFNVQPLPSTASVRQGDVGAVDLVIERIPFEGEEVSSLTFQITGPAGSEAPTLEIEQLVDGQSVGGNVLRPQVPIQIHLPLVLKNYRRP